MTTAIRPVREVAAALVAALVLAAAGCGEDDGADKTSRAKGKPAIGTAAPVAARPSLLGDAGATASAGTTTGYAPRGEIIADSGFRPETDGFAFENYGNDVEPQNLTPANIHALFGDRVCIGGGGSRCRLIPPARRWMDNENAQMDGGHCMGFSVAALRMYEGNLDPQEFGGAKASGLAIQGNVDLQSSIAEHWVYQHLPRIQRGIVAGTPSEIVDRLAKALGSGKEDYTLGILMADGTGGHAITPFAIEDRGGDRYAILVYDNNFPGITRAVQVDAARETWRYVGGTNPKNLGEVYAGDADTQTMVLLPTTPGEQVQPCPFCRAQAGGSGGGTSLGSARQAPVQITLTGSLANHPHLVLFDEEGRRTGIVGGRMLREIPGVRVRQSFSTRNWEASPEPSYEVPAGRDIAFTVDGAALKRAAKASIDLVGNGLVVAIDEIRVAPKQEDTIFLAGDGYGLIYESGGKGEASPDLYAGVEDGDASYTFAATALGLKPHSTIGLIVDRESGHVLLDGEGTRGRYGDKAFFGLLVEKQTADRTLTWGTHELELNGKHKDGVIFDYRHTPKAGRPLRLEVGPSDGPTKTVRAPYIRD